MTDQSPSPQSKLRGGATAYLFSKPICREIHERRCLEAISEAIARYSKFSEIRAMENTSQLAPNRRKTSEGDEDPIIMMFTRR